MQDSWGNDKSSRMDKLFLQKGKERHRGKAIGRDEGKEDRGREVKAMRQ